MLQASSSGAAENKSILQVVLPFGGEGLLQVEEKPLKVEGITNLEQGLEQELNAKCKVEVVKAESAEAIRKIPEPYPCWIASYLPLKDLSSFCVSIRVSSNGNCILYTTEMVVHFLPFYIYSKNLWTS